MRLEAGAIRYALIIIYYVPLFTMRFSELHWHKTAEWSYILKGSAQVTVVNPDGQNYLASLVSTIELILSRASSQLSCPASL